MLHASILEIEHRALRAWPAAETEQLDGWRLRAMSGVSRRANAVWTSEATGASTLADRIAAAERFYARRGLPALFQIAPTSVPTGLDQALADRGYVTESPVLVQVARAREVTPSTRRVSVRLDEELTEPWFELSAVQGRFGKVQDIYRGLLERLGSRALYALAEVGGQPAAVGLAVRETRWLGFSSMFTLPQYRGLGAARSILAALAAWALGHDADALYLQVEQDNHAARALYATAGFSTHHAYHYRVATRAINAPR